MAKKDQDKRTISFTKQKYKELKKRYDEAVANKEKSFMFGDQELVTDYAKYMLEYYEMMIKPNLK